MANSLMQHLMNRWRPKKKAVLILGSGRSGTSVLTKCISFMGISLGTNNLLGPSKKINPKGYFENKDVIKIHKSIGSKIRYRPAFAGYEDSAKIKKDRENLTKYLTDFFADERYLAIKDPRMNDYIELWQAVLADINVQPAEIILIRNPIDVVNSNSRAWHRDATLALRQWQVRTLLSLRDTKNQNRILITYEALFNETLPTLKRIADQLQLPWPSDEGTLQAEIDGFIDPNLQHSDSAQSLADFKADNNIDPDAKTLYLLAVRAANDPEFFESEEFDLKIKQLTDQYVTKHGSLYRDFNKKIPGKTVYVWGNDAAAVEHVNDQLTELGVVLQTADNTRAHQLQTQLSQKLSTSQPWEVTYPKDYALVSDKEDLNNFIRKHAKHDDVWGLGDVAASSVVEMIMAVSDEMGLATRNLVLVADFEQLQQDPAALKVALRSTVRVLHAVKDQPYLIIPAAAVTQPDTQTQLATFVQQDEVVVETNSAVSMPEAPLTLAQVAQNLAQLITAASQDPANQAALQQYLALYHDKILKQIGD
ncbi:sulfotransferase family protein [Lactiplantibacillus mudanjiangensis]|uniref:Sulfotransferase family protein n=1 Tax=Lactiplantibacillus mudanjiangensis TaxID=1296538 RepID=A0A660DVW5_9LACO|nr:hypothetical protein [Lactiplantibacillus mudanjiangensis]VDG18977.1 hypothetical protein [Lactobacillus sp. CBA3606] [Lactiplantibacillus mudanjiangensis]VDG25248.1 hypothetical protein [Lactobacillus sp. CBA3606] [Lactiplantibacillus mudanjiangensis]VDG27498.1 hypothetical protein [Lactobacillus sp. CBA3606] [Lactiplantibacillus mudanjiangensis]